MKDSLLLVALTGRSGAGKSTVAKILVKEYGFIRVSFADPIREIAQLFGFDTKKPYSPETRKALQAIGYTGRMIDKDAWCKILAKKIEKLMQLGVKKIVIDDLRFLNECEFLKKLGFFIVKIEVPEEVLRERMKELYVPGDMESEREIEYIEADLTVDGTTSPENIVVLILNTLFNRLRTEGNKLVLMSQAEHK